MHKAIVPASIIALILSVAALDRLIFPALESHKCMWGADWTEENKRIFEQNCLRNWASKDEPLFRTHLMQPRKDRPGARILVLGDSFVWGDGYSNLNDIWWRQLGRELSSRGYGNVEVLGAGYPGYSTRSETKAAEKLIDDLEPDLVIWGYETNDADEGLVAQSFTHPVKPATPGIFKKILPNISYFVGRQFLTHIQETENPATYSEPEWELKLLQGENYERFSDTVQDLGQLLARKRTNGLLVTLPQTPDLEYNEARFKPVEQLFQKAHVPCLDLSPDFKTWYSSSVDHLMSANPLASLHPAVLLRINPANSHPSAPVTHFYADRVADYLELKYKDMLGKGTQATAPAIVINDCVPIYALTKRSGGSFELNYPAAPNLLKMPVHEPFVQLNLETPSLLKHVSLHGRNLRKATIYLSDVDPKLHCDAGAITALPELSGKDCQWSLTSDTSERPTNSIRISATFERGTRDQHLTLQLQ